MKQTPALLSPNPLPRRTSLDGRRSFACFPAAVLVFIINERKEFLLLKHPRRNGWEIVNGALEDGETVLAGALRETAEEAGPQVVVKPVGVVHVSSFHYDANAPFMISIGYVMSYLSGPIAPGDDMTGSEFRWAAVAEIGAGAFPVLVPPDKPWVFQRALEVHDLWNSRQDVLQTDITTTRASKYEA